jgi:hypothetical protein
VCARAGTVTVHVAEGQQVDGRQLVASIEEDPE